jgi:hypothetical protein
MREDKSLGILLILLFGISGIAIIMLAWLWAALTSGKIVATLVGSAGLFIALTRIFMLKRFSVKADKERIPVKVKTESNS